MIGQVLAAESSTSDTCEYLKWSPEATSDISLPSDSQAPETTSDITGHDQEHPEAMTRRRRGATPTPLPERYSEVFATYETSVSRPGTPLDDDTVRAYLSRVRQYLAWLDDATTAGAVEGDALVDPDVRDWAARDYRSHLMTVAKRKPTTVNAHLTAIDDFNRRIGLGPASVKRTEPPHLAPKALDQRAQVRFLREAERAPIRDRALAHIGFYAGTRIAELAALNLDDIHISARKGMLVIRYGKGGKYREVPLHPQLRATLESYLIERAKAGVDSTALFLNHRGERLTTRGIYDVLIGLANTAGVEEFTPHVLRHTLGTKLRREGVDIVIVAELLGHSVEVARRYALPTEDERQAAIEKLTTDQ